MALGIPNATCYNFHEPGRIRRRERKGNYDVHRQEAAEESCRSHQGLGPFVQSQTILQRILLLLAVDLGGFGYHAIIRQVACHALSLQVRVTHIPCACYECCVNLAYHGSSMTMVLS